MDDETYKKIKHYRSRVAELNDLIEKLEGLVQEEEGERKSELQNFTVR